MEKFGIFELLDTLSAILAGENGSPLGQKPSGEDASSQAAAPSSPPPGAAPQGENAALSSFLARHDNVSKKIDGK